MDTTKKFHLTFLFLLMFAFFIPKYSFSWTDDEKNRVLNFVTQNQTTWSKRIIWLIIPILIQVTLSELIITFLSVRKTEEEKARDKIESMVSINHEIKKQMEYVKPLCKNKKLLDTIDKKYVSTFSKILDEYDQYLYTYSKKIKDRENEH